MKNNTVTIVLILIVLGGVSYMLFGDSPKLNFMRKSESNKFVDVSMWPIGSEKMVAVLEVSPDGNYIQLDKTPTIIVTTKENLNKVKTNDYTELGVIIPKEITTYEEIKKFMESLTRNVTFIVAYDTVPIDVVKYADNNNKYIVVLSSSQNASKTIITSVKVDGVQIMTPVVITPYYNIESETDIPVVKSLVYQRLFNSTSNFVLIAFNSNLPESESVNDILNIISLGEKTFNPDTYKKPSWILGYIKEATILKSIIDATQEVTVQDGKVIVTISIPEWKQLETIKIYKVVKVSGLQGIEKDKVELDNINIISNGRETKYVTKLDKSDSILLYPSINLENVVIKIEYKE